MMNELDGEALRDAGLAFLGRVVSVQTHEVTNAFSVINEMAGLQWDILSDAANGQPADLLELENICEKIRAHVRRGEAAVRSINWIAHSVDQLVADLDIGEMLEKVRMVSEHWMRLRKAHFVLDLPEPSEVLTARPFFLAYALLVGVDAVTSESGGAQTVSMGYAGVEGGAEFLLEGSAKGTGNRKKIDTARATLTAIMAAVGGELRQPLGGAPMDNRVAFFVPNQTPCSDCDDLEKKEARE